MFNLTESIQNWKNLTGRSGVAEDAVEELESHLRDTIDELMEAGHSEEEAFAMAVERMGPGGEIAKEFRKVESSARFDRIAVGLLGLMAAGSVILLLIFLSGRLADSKGPLLVIHVGFLTLGFLELVFLFALGAYASARRAITQRGESPLFRMLRRILAWGLPLGMGLTAVGLVGGCLWSLENLGTVWSWSVKEAGPLLVLAWYVASMGLLGLKVIGERALPFLLLSAGIMVHFVWFLLGGMPFTTVSVLFAIVVAVFLVLEIKAGGMARRDPAVAEA